MRLSWGGEGQETFQVRSSEILCQLEPLVKAFPYTLGQSPSQEKITLQPFF